MARAAFTYLSTLISKIDSFPNVKIEKLAKSVVDEHLTRWTNNSGSIRLNRAFETRVSKDHVPHNSAYFPIIFDGIGPVNPSFSLTRLADEIA